MKVLSLIVGLYLFSILFLVPYVAAQDGYLLQPVPLDDVQLPTLTVISPEKDSVVSSKLNLEMKVTNFELTAKPVESSMAGVIAIYVDGKFFTNTASSSAQITLPKIGTHHIEAELTHVDRSPVVPRVSESFYVHVQKKTPYLELLGLRAEGTIYIEKPQFSIDYVPASFEDKSKYYQVFIDGKVDGTSKDLDDPARYTIITPLTEGKHSLRLALYNDNDRPYIPIVDYQVPFTYSAVRPTIDSIKMEPEIELKQPFNYEVKTSNFEIGKDGYVDVLSEGVHHYLTTGTGNLPNLSIGNQKITFTLLDHDGLPLNPEVTVQKIVSVKGAAPASHSLNSLIPVGTFFTASDSSEPRWGYIFLGGIEAVAIIIFGILLLKHEKHK